MYAFVSSLTTTTTTTTTVYMRSISILAVKSKLYMYLGSMSQ